jgi:hypothetical protein
MFSFAPGLASYSAWKSNYNTIGVLNLGNNRLTGPLPMALTATKLSHLQLYENKITGTIPEDIGSSTRMRKLACARESNCAVCCNALHDSNNMMK